MGVLLISSPSPDACSGVIAGLLGEGIDNIRASFERVCCRHIGRVGCVACRAVIWRHTNNSVDPSPITTPFLDLPTHHVGACDCACCCSRQCCGGWWRCRQIPPHPTGALQPARQRHHRQGKSGVPGQPRRRRARELCRPRCWSRCRSCSPMPPQSKASEQRHADC